MIRAAQRALVGHRQRGQAMTEFVAAMALFIPLLLGIIYLFKYGDIKHQAIQASRYAAMAHALDPNDGAVPSDTVARFFRDGGKYGITADDKASEATAGDENPNWDQNDGTPMLASYSDVNVTLTSPPIESSQLTQVNEVAARFDGLATEFGTRADITVPLANVLDFAPLSSIDAQIHATTVIAGDTWSGGGPANVASHLSAWVNPAQAMTWIDNPAFTALFDAFVAAPPQFGCIKPDIVPATAAPGASYDSNDTGGVNTCH